MHVIFRFFIFLAFSLLCFSVSAAPGNFVYQGQIIKPNGQALEASSVTFTLQIFSPGVEECLLYEENKVLNMTSSNGLFSIEVGTGTRNGVVDYEDVTSLAVALSNSTGLVTPSTCLGGVNYTPAATDGRILRVTFDDGSGPVTLAQDHNIVSVPYAVNAGSINGLAAGDILQANTGGSYVLNQANLEKHLAT